MKTQIEKRKSFAFNKDIYLLGQDKEGINYWLEAPSWDCDWYWGFGYVETYTNNNNPDMSKDIVSHEHINNNFIRNNEYYDHDKECFRREYINNIYDSHKLEKTTFSENEGWKLSELFNQFYLLKNMADFCHKDNPGCHISNSPVNHGNMKDLYDKINKEMIPRVTNKILEILSPIN